ALAVSRHLTKVAPKPAHSAYMGTGRILDQQGKPEEAIAIYRKLIKDDPKNERAYNALGYALDSQNKRGEAIAVLRQGLKHLPEEVQLHLGLARILWNQRRLAEAADRYRPA